MVIIGKLIKYETVFQKLEIDGYIYEQVIYKID